MVIFSCENSKVATCCKTTIGRRMLDPTKNRYPTSKGKGDAPSKMVGGAKSHLESNPMPARDTWRAQTKPCVYQGPGAPQRLTRPAFECLSVSC